jgi:hypothetical protein
VRVLPGATPQVYDEAVRLSGANPITLSGPGRDSATRMAHSMSGGGCSTGGVVCVENASLVQDLHVVQTSAALGWYALTTGGSGIAERVLLEAPASYTLQGSGVIRDAVLNGVVTGYNGRLVRSTVNSTAIGLVANLGTELIDTIVRVTPGGSGSFVCPVGTGVCVNAMFPLAASAKLRHVTVVAQGPRLLVQASGMPATLEAVNSTFAGASGTDVRLSGASAIATLTRSNVSASRTDFVSGANSSQLQLNDPVDVAPALAVDGHLLEDSPLRDLGVVGGMLSGPEDLLDVDGQARSQGLAPDIGADELPAVQSPGGGPNPAGTIPGGSGSGGLGTGGSTPGADSSAPVFLSASLTNKVFAVSRKATPLTSQVPRVPRGTRIKYTLSEDATVAIAVHRALPGRREGRRCVAPNSRLRGAPRCTRYRTAGTLRRSSHQGQNAVAFSGRLGSRALRPGRYRAVLRAKDAAGNASPSRALRFRLVRP